MTQEDDSQAFEDTEAAAEEWVDVRMTEPHVGEWDIDVVVANGQVEYVDLRVHPDQISAFLACLVGDVPDQEARTLLTTVAEDLGVDLSETE
jgi:hypothetical protein